MADVITRFRLETTQFDSKLRDSSKSLSDYTRLASLAGKDFDKFTKSNVEAARALGKLESGAMNAKDKVKDLVGAFNAVAREYNALTKQQQQSDFGKTLAQSMTELKSRIREAKQEMYGLKDAAKAQGGGNLMGSLMGAVGGQFGGLGGSLLGAVGGGAMPQAAAIGLAVSAAKEAVQAFADYNAELSKNDQLVEVSLDIHGKEAEKISDVVRSLAQVYGVNFNEAIGAATTLMKQFGLSSEETLQLMRDGLQGMTRDNAPKLLSMIQQYAPAFRDAGIAADQFVAIIHNTEGGLFTEQNMSAITFGIKNIRLMTKGTADALRQLGIDGEEMSRQIQDGTISVFEALQQVATKLQEVDSGSKAAGEVMQAVFGRQGVTAGTNLGKAIAELNVNLEETKTQTGDIGKSYADLEKATERLNTALRATVGVDDWEALSNVLKTELTNAIADVLVGVQKVGLGIRDMAGYISILLGPLGLVHRGFNLLGVNGKMAINGIKTAVMALINPLSSVISLLRGIGMGSLQSAVNKVAGEAKLQQFKNSSLYKTLKNFPGGSEDVSNPPEPPLPPFTPLPRTTGGDKHTTVTQNEQTEEQRLNKEIEERVAKYQELATLAKTASEADIQGIQKQQKEIRKEIQLRQDRLTELKKFANEAKGVVGKVKPEAKEPASIDFSGTTTATLAAWSKFGQESLAGTAVGSEDYNRIYANLVDVKSLNSIINEAAKRGVVLDQETVQSIFSNLTDPESWEGVRDQIKEFLEKINADLKEGIEPIKINLETGSIEGIKKESKTVEKGWTEAAKAVQSTGSALNSIEDPAIKTVGLIAQAIANVTLGFSKALSGGTMSPWEWIAAAAAGTATMFSTVAAIKAVNADAGKYAEGGIIPGNSYSGDNLTAHVNSGELILSRAQQDTVAAELASAGGGVGSITGYLSGEELYLVINNYLSRSGMGEIATTKG